MLGDCEPRRSKFNSPSSKSAPAAFVAKRSAPVMSQTYNSGRAPQHNPQEDMGGGLFVLAGLGVTVFLLASGAAVFAASTTAGVAVLLVVAVCGTLGVDVYRKTGWKSWRFTLLIAAIVWALLGGVIVFQNHWLAFAPAAWVLNGLYVAALFSGVWTTVNGWLKALAGLTAVSLVVATCVLPRPPGGEGPGDTNKQWKVEVQVVGQDDQPLENALVLCGAVMSWERTWGLSSAQARPTDSDGRIPTWEFDEDPRLKVVVCTVWKNATDGNAEYPSATQFIFSPQGGGEYQLSFKLTENPHPETAFLTLHPTGQFEQAWYTLQFELWAGEPTGSFGSRDGAQPWRRKSWHELKGGGFTIPADLALQDWRLRYFYEGPGGPGLVPPYSEVRTVEIGPIEPGTRRQIRPTIPNRSTDGRQP